MKTPCHIITEIPQVVTCNYYIKQKFTFLLRKRLHMQMYTPHCVTHSSSGATPLDRGGLYLELWQMLLREREESSCGWSGQPPLPLPAIPSVLGAPSLNLANMKVTYVHLNKG